MPCPHFLMRRIATAILTLFWFSTTPAAEDALEDARDAFVQAYARVGAADPEAGRVDGDLLRSYPLYPYLQAARLRHSLLNTADSLEPIDERVAAFLTHYEREPVAHDLRRDWLESLAERRQWSSFMQQYRDDLATDALRCESFNARIALQRTENLADEIAAQWLTPQSLPECEQPFAWLRAQDRLSPALIEQRARLTLEKGKVAFARQIIGQLPAVQAAPLLQWAALMENPQRGIDTLIGSPATTVEPAAMLAGWSLLARKDRSAAMGRYELLRSARRLDDKSASPYALALALPLAWDRDPAALSYFTKVQPADFNDLALEWQARAGLWAGNWKLVTDSIAAMTDTTRNLARWRYWSGRAAEHRHDADLARQLYRSVLADDNYYSAMAAARLDEPITPHPEKLVLDRTVLREIQQLSPFVRSRELLRVNLRGEAVAEWQFGYESLTEAQRPQTIHMAADWGWMDQAVATATQQKVFNDYALLYPRPFDREVRNAAKLTDIDPQLIYGVLRQESLYRADAVSSAGAYGVMQLLPATARHTAQRWKRPRPSTTDLFDPSINVTLGAGQLRMLLDRFGGQTAVALAGYNAGPNAAARWLPEQAIDPDIWVENIPYNETRTYVQRVLWHSVVFAWLRSGDSQRTDAWLARIGSNPDPAVLGTL